MFKVQRFAGFVMTAIILAAGLPTGRFAQQATQNPQQTQTPGQDTVRINTQLVQVDAVVTDKKGRHVEDLTQEDFELLVDGKKQPLTYFKHINLPNLVKRELAPKKKTDAKPAPESMPTRQIEPSQVQRTLAFIVDDLGLSFKSTEFVRETLRKFVAEQMQEGDLVAIIRTGNGLGMLEQFTSDKRILYSAIEKLTWNPLSRDMNPTFSDAGAEVSDDQSEKQAVLDQFEEFRGTSFTIGTLGAINFVVQGLRSLPGRKSVVLLSDGFRINSQSNDDNSTQLLLQQLQGVAEVARRSSVVVYSIDAKGLQPFNPGADVGGKMSASAFSDAIDSAQAALEGPVFLSNLTGGFTVTNTNDLNIGIQEALYDQQSYYILGFDPDDEKFDRKFHKIKIRALRPGLNVRTNAGFFGEREEAAPPAQTQTRGQQILAALLSPLGKRDLTVKMTPYFFNATKEGSLVRALFHIDCSKLTFKDGANGQKQLSLDLAAFAFDESGATVDMMTNRINLTFTPQQYQQVMANGLAYRKDFALKKPGAYQFRTVLRDDTSGNAGTAGQFIQVPDLSKSRLAMSGLVLTTPKTVTDKPAETSQLSGLPASPYVRQFPRVGWLQYGAAIYNATTDKKNPVPQITVQAEIYRDGKAIHQFPARLLEVTPGTNPKRFDYVSQLRLNNFPEGEYLLRLIVTDGLAKKKFARVEQWMDFSVR